MFNLVAADSEDQGEELEYESALDADFGTLRHEVGSMEISTLELVFLVHVVTVLIEDLFVCLLGRLLERKIGDFFRNVA